MELAARQWCCGPYCEPELVCPYWLPEPIHSCTDKIKHEENACRFGMWSKQNPSDFGFGSDELADLEDLRSQGFGDNSNARNIIKKMGKGKQNWIELCWIMDWGTVGQLCCVRTWDSNFVWKRKEQWCNSRLLHDQSSRKLQSRAVIG